MDQQYPTVAKIPMLDTRKFEQWQFRMQQYLQYEHYALWEVIEFEDSYVVPANDSSTTTTNITSGEKSRRTVTLTTEDMQRKKNDIKARTTLLLSLPDEHQLRFSQLQFMGVEVEQDDLNQKFLTSLAPEWLMHTIIDEDDMEEMDIKWNMVLLSMRADKFWQKTGKKISIQGSDVTWFDKSKVECFNCHKMGHFVRELTGSNSPFFKLNLN
nr:hypothetical protein [Tanacetum cinerariifolium]